MTTLLDQLGMKKLIYSVGMEEIKVVDDRQREYFGKANLNLAHALLDFINYQKATLYHFNPSNTPITKRRDIHLVAVFDKGDQEGDYRKATEKFDVLREFSQNGIHPDDYAVLEEYEREPVLFPYTVSFSPLSSVRSGWRKISLTKMRDFFSKEKSLVNLSLITQNDLKEKLSKRIVIEKTIIVKKTKFPSLTLGVLKK